MFNKYNAYFLSIMLLQFFWSQTDPDAPISYTTYYQYLQFSKLRFSQYPQLKKHQN